MIWLIKYIADFSGKVIYQSNVQDSYINWARWSGDSPGGYRNELMRRLETTREYVPGETYLWEVQTTHLSDLGGEYH